MRKVLRRHTSDPLDGELYIRSRKMLPPKQLFTYRWSHCRKDRGVLRRKLAAAPTPGVKGDVHKIIRILKGI
jgi:hypothetical protein